MKKNSTQNFLHKNGFMRFVKFLLVGIFLIFQLGAYGQGKTVTGTVTEDDGTPLAGVTVIIRGTTQGTLTDIEGKYSLPNVPDNATLSFSFVGMRVREIAVGTQTTINVALETDAFGLDEVIVIGYGTARKKDLTGSVVNVQAEDFLKYQPAGVGDMLRSAVPGLKVTYSTDARNTPDFEIRGDNTIKSDAGDEAAANRPLIVLDGVIFNGDLAEINVNDIESVDVLKDASAASIYGSRASNGVIVFTTKKGALGAPVIRASAKVGIVTGSRRLETFKGGDEVMTWLTDMNESINDLSTAEWSKFDKFENVPAANQADWLIANGIPGATDPTVIATAWIDGFGFEPNEKENFLNGTVYDWQDFLFQTGVRQDYDLSISGRTDRVSYYWSLGYINNESVQVGETFSSITSRLNLDVKATDYLSLGILANFAYQNEGQEPIGGGAYRTASPYDQPWLNGMPHEREFLKEAGAGSNRENPLLNPAYMTRLYDRYRIFPTMYAKLKLPFGITLTSNLTTRLDFRRRLSYEDGANPRWGHGGYVQRRNNQTFEWQSDNILNWDKEFGQHRFSVTGLVNAERNQSWFTNASGTQFSPTEALGYHGLPFALIPGVDSDDQATSRNALMGRLNYAFADRYNFSASMRRDGYSRFGTDNQYATFPSISAAWTITNESFMAGRPGFLSSLKIRASWGVNGNSSGLGSYAAYASLSDNKYLNWDNGYFVAPYLTISRIANPTLAWEKNQSWNVALDYGLWNGRVSGSFDFYTSITTDLLLDKKLPTVTGFSSITTNVGSLKNSGFDLQINTVNVEASNFRWTTTLNVTYNQNKIVSLTGEKLPVIDADGNPVLDSNGNPVMEEPDDIDNGWFIGENKDIIWELDQNGIYQVGEEAEAAIYNLYPGDFKVIDQNNDGVINSADKKFLGVSSNPWYITLRNDLEYKGFDIGIIFLAKLGYLGGSGEPFNEDQTYIKNHNWYNIPYWTPTNGINTAARVNSIQISDMWIYTPLDYLRLQNVSLGYTLPGSLLDFLKFDRARVAFDIDNAFVMTKWIYGDPESQSEMPRTYSFSIDISF